MTFRVGDRIEFRHPEFESVTGIVARIEIPYPGALHILMWPDTIHPRFGLPTVPLVNGRWVYRFAVEHCYHLEMGPPPPPEYKVLQKCKTLWNNSTWVKAHPNMAY